MIDYISRIEEEIKRNPRWKIIRCDGPKEYVLLHSKSKNVHIHIPRINSGGFWFHIHPKIERSDEYFAAPDYATERGFDDPEKLINYLPHAGILDPERPSKYLLELLALVTDPIEELNRVFFKKNL